MTKETWETSPPPEGWEKHFEPDKTDHHSGKGLYYHRQRVDLVDQVRPRPPVPATSLKPKTATNWVDDLNQRGLTPNLDTPGVKPDYYWRNIEPRKYPEPLPTIPK